ncbi:MAG: hypothetical protein Q9183_006503 [Haloplaca sp. 2 TL-2023]
MDAGSNRTNPMIDNQSGLGGQETIRGPQYRSLSHDTISFRENESESDLLTLSSDREKLYDIIELLEEWHASETTVLHLLRRHIQHAFRPLRNGETRGVGEQRRRMGRYIRGSTNVESGFADWSLLRTAVAVTRLRRLAGFRLLGLEIQVNAEFYWL